MIEVGGQNDERLNITCRMFASEAQRRGWRMWIYDNDSDFYRLERPDGKILELYGSTPPSVSGPIVLRADDKYVTQLLLEEHGLPVLKAFRFLANEKGEMIQMFPTLLEDGKKWVTKPLDQAHGCGITIGIDSIELLQKGVSRAQAFSQSLLLQEYYGDFIDLRLTCIDYSFVAAAHRIPARVRGDGMHTLAELISIENQRPERGAMHKTALTVIHEEDARAYLGSAINDIPAIGEWRQVVAIANASRGGETVDVTDDIPAWLREMVEKAVRVAELPVCGVDVLLSGPPTLDATSEQLRPIIIELNKAPGLRVHEYVAHGTRRPMSRLLFDYLEKL